MKQVVLVQHAIGEVGLDNFGVIDLVLPELKDGEYLIENKQKCRLPSSYTLVA